MSTEQHFQIEKIVDEYYCPNDKIFRYKTYWLGHSDVTWQSEGSVGQTFYYESFIVSANNKVKHWKKGDTILYNIDLSEHPDDTNNSNVLIESKFEWIPAKITRRGQKYRTIDIEYHYKNEKYIRKNIAFGESRIKSQNISEHKNNASELSNTNNLVAEESVNDARNNNKVKQLLRNLNIDKHDSDSEEILFGVGDDNWVSASPFLRNKDKFKKAIKEQKQIECNKLIEELQDDNKNNGDDILILNKNENNEEMNRICPLTLKRIKIPIKNIFCCHSFEKDAIYGYKQYLFKNQKPLICPQSGCSAILFV